MSLQNIEVIENGAKFYRADLHIHSLGPLASYDVADYQMTPNRIIDEAIKKNISIISITDHNEIGNIPAAISYAADKDVLVIPGVELSTSQGHLLVYFETYEKIRSFLGELSISEDKKQCDTTITGALDIAGRYYGFGIAAHIDHDNGFEAYTPGYTPFKEAILQHELLYGLEISNKSLINWFTDLDDNADRKRLFRGRRSRFGEDNSYNTAKIMSSDAHSLSALGRNISGSEKLTRLKLNSLDFNSFRVAFLDANSRVRIEENIPSSFPKFIGVEFEGGILDNRSIHFSDNFNCFIGGRGTGKSTAIECIRSASGNPSTDDIIDNEVWPDTIKLYYQDQAGQIIEFNKQKYNPTINFTDSVYGLQKVTIESFGQGETASIIKKCGEDPEILLNFIDTFIDINSFEIKDESIRTELLTNQSVKERLRLELDRIPSIEQAYKNAKGQLDTLKSNKAKEIVELEEGIAKERTLRAELSITLEDHIQKIADGLNTKSLKDSLDSIPESEIIVGKSEYKAVSNLMKEYLENVSMQSSQVITFSTDFKSKLKLEIAKWQEKEVDITKKIEDKRKTLETQGVKLDISFIRKVTKDVSEYSSKLKDLTIRQKQYQELKNQRKKLIADRKVNLDELYNERYKFVYSVNANLKGTVVDYEVDLRIDEHNLSSELVDIIKTVMGYRTAQVPKSNIIVDKINYFELLKAIYRKDPTVLINLTNYIGQRIFSEDEAKEIINRLKETSILGQIERVIVKDKPIITIRKVIQDDDGATSVVERDFSKLSMGQQQSILLTLLLYSKRNCPLIIDQPEDNLDSEFIYKTLVKNLKRIKERRQVIIATHNANIAVLGDSELILPLKSTNEKTSIVDRGSIDDKKTNKMACNILEGGESAFKKRQQIYNL